MSGIPLRDRVVEVICDRGPSTGGRWTAGTGFLVGGKLVLTAAHLVASGGVITVRRIERGFPPFKAEWGARAKLIGDVDVADLALLELDSEVGGLPPGSFARIDRDSAAAQVIYGCWAVGFPHFQVMAGPDQAVRETVQVEGVIPPAEGLYSGLLTFRVSSTPRPLPPREEAAGRSQWSGMSGAAVLVGDRIVGVVGEHNPRAGESALTVTPITQVDRLPPEFSRMWWQMLGMDSASIPVIEVSAGLPGEPGFTPARTSAAIADIVAGLRELPTDYSGRVKNFLAEYLGGQRLHVPFGGRSHDLAELDSWLDDPAAPPYLLLSAPAGRGKSALLAHWSQSLVGRSGVALVYFPVSIRYRTNLAGVVFPALIARLAGLYGERHPADVNLPTEAWRALLADFLSRPGTGDRRVVVILDGLDEGADWAAGPDLFPLDPPDGLRLVVAARSVANDTEDRIWLDQLGWENPALARSMTLRPLDHTAITDVVAQAPRVVTSSHSQAEIVDELHRLTEGDPLLVRLYADTFFDPRADTPPVTLRELRATPPGLEGYFKRWWEDQRRLWGQATSPAARDPAVQAVLDLLACALGPLTKDDICQLAVPETQLNTWMIESVIDNLRRIVIGDDEQGYSFCHSRLADFFYDRLIETDKEATRRRYQAWGDRVLVALDSGELSPQLVPQYLVQYYGAHLERW
jgi:hypothetical protein